MALLLFKWFFVLLLGGTSGTKETQKNKDSLNHPFYISVTEISHNATDKNLEISCKIFTDDFETALAKANGAKIDLFNPRDKQAVEKQIAAYIRKHLVIKLDNKPVVLEFVGFERENEAVWSYLQAGNTPAPKKVDINNDLLYDSFNQQINLMHISVGGSRKSTKLNYPDASASFQF
jgi:hypothetical protein